MSDAVTVHPRHAWILGVVADDAEIEQNPQDLELRDDNGKLRAPDAKQVADERRDEG